MAQVPLHRAPAEEKPRADLGVREAIAGQFGDLPLLRRQLVARVDGPLADGLARRQQLAASAFGERLHADRGEVVESDAELGRARRPGGSFVEATLHKGGECGRARLEPWFGSDGRWPRGTEPSARSSSLSRARERASIPSAQSVPVALAFRASRFWASTARSVLPVRVAGSISSLRPQFSATTSRCSLAATAAASASSYRPRPLQRTARAYALMASPMPSPRAAASRSVVSIRSDRLALSALPGREDQRAVRCRPYARRVLDRLGLGNRRGGRGELSTEH